MPHRYPLSPHQDTPMTHHDMKNQNHDPKNFHESFQTYSPTSDLVPNHAPQCFHPPRSHHQSCTQCQRHTVQRYRKNPKEPFEDLNQKPPLVPPLHQRPHNPLPVPPHPHQVHTSFPCPAPYFWPSPWASTWDLDQVYPSDLGFHPLKFCCHQPCSDPGSNSFDRYDQSFHI